MQAENSDRLWKTLVQLTESFEPSVVQSVRIPLYTSLKTGDGLIHLERAKRSWRFWTKVLRKKQELPQFSGTRRGPLFGFFYRSSSNLSNLLPVALEASSRGIRYDVVLGEGVDVPRDRFGLGVHYMNYGQIWGLAPIRERLASFRTAGALLRRIMVAAQSFAPHLRTALDERAGLLRQELVSALILRTAMRRLLGSWKPTCVVSTSDFWPFEHTLFAVAREMEVPTFCIQHGVIADFWWPCASSKLLLWGQLFQQQMLTLGAPLDRLQVCGMPASDSLFAKHKMAQQARDTSSGPLKCVILSNTQGVDHYLRIYEKYAAFLKMAVPNIPNVAWIIKLHPNDETDAFYRALGVEVFRKLRFLPRNISIEAAVETADVACTLFSTAGLEAMILQRPLVVLALDDQIRQWIWWPANGGGEYITDWPQMQRHFSRLQTETTFYAGSIVSQNEFLERSFANRGHSSQAIVNLLENSGSASNDAHRGLASELTPVV